MNLNKNNLLFCFRLKKYVSLIFLVKITPINSTEIIFRQKNKKYCFKFKIFLFV